MIIQPLPPPTQSDFDQKLLDAYLVHLLWQGHNSFFGPFVSRQLSQGRVAVPWGTSGSSPIELEPWLYADVQNALGLPTGPFTSQQKAGSPSPGYRVYQRMTEGGIVYLNWSGVTQTVTLPTDRLYYDHSGNRVTQLTILDMSGDYTLIAPGRRSPMPRINPRLSSPVTGSITIRMETPFDSTTTIHYTLDGSEPTRSSTLYIGPFQLTQSAVVKAKSFSTGRLDSFTSKATYEIKTSAPLIQFYTTSENRSQAAVVHYPLVALSNPSSITVTVDYKITGGTAVNGTDYALANGTLIFPPGDNYNYFPIQLINNTVRNFKKAVVITLSNPKNATLGNNQEYTLTINP